MHIWSEVHCDRAQLGARQRQLVAKQRPRIFQSWVTPIEQVGAEQNSMRAEFANPFHMAEEKSFSDETRQGSLINRWRVLVHDSAHLDEGIDELRETVVPLRILTGIEVDILEDGSLDQETERPENRGAAMDKGSCS